MISKTKFLALFLTVCMMLTSIGTFGIVASAADAVTEINVGQGVTYLLPDGETYADTSKVGYRIVKGTDGVTYRVNVGEYKELMRDTFETYTEDQYITEISGQKINGGKFTKDAYSAADKSGQQLTKDGNNTVLSVGPYSNGWGTARWTPEDKEVGDAFKLSMKLKVAEFDSSNSSGTTNYFVQLRPAGTAGVSFRTKTNSSREITTTQVRYESATSNNADVDVNWENNNGIYSMNEYVELSIEGNGVQYSAFLNDTELVHSQIWKSPSTMGESGLSSIDVAKGDKYAVTNAVTYIDEVVYSKAIYVTDTLENVSVETAVDQGDSEVQTATVALNMSDGTTKDFTVRYIADTSSEGVKTADGKIDGFDGTIPVTYTVSGMKEVLNDDFQNAVLGTLTPGNPLNGWTVTNTKGTVDDTVITFEKEEYPNHHITSNNVLKINRTADDTADSKDYVLRRELSKPVTSKNAEVMSVKFNILRNNNNTIKFTVGLESEYAGGVARSPFEFMLVASQIYLPGSDTPIYFDGKYDEYSPRVGIWHEFEILADIKNDYVYFYEQDKLLGSGRIENAAQKIYGLSAITLESDSTGNGSFNNGGGFIWIDNIKVELFTQEAALQEAGKRLSRLFRGRISDDIELPTKGWYDTSINWESDNSTVVNAQTGAVTRPTSGSISSANLTATVSKSGLTADKFYYTAVVNPQTVVLDESFEYPRTVDGQPMSARPYTGGMVPWHGWMPEVGSTKTTWDTSGTIVEENEGNKAFSLERDSNVSTDSNLYTWIKNLTEPVSATERASVSFRVKREANSPNIRIGFGEDWVTEVRLGTGKLYHSTTWSGQPKFEKEKSSANFDEWYNLDFLIDFPNSKCYAYCDNQFVAEGAIPEGVTFDSIMMTHYRASAGTSDSKALIDDIVVNKMSETEFNAKKSAYDNAALFNTLIKDVSLDRGMVSTVAIRNSEAISNTSGVIVAEYDRNDEKLQNVKIYDIPDASDASIMQTIPVGQNASSGNIVKIFVWDKSNLKPLALVRETIIP